MSFESLMYVKFTRAQFFGNCNKQRVKSQEQMLEDCAIFFFSLFFFTRIFLVTFSVVLIVLVTNFLSCFNDIILDDENSFAC